MFQRLVTKNTSNHTRCARPSVNNNKMAIEHSPSRWNLPQKIDTKVQANNGHGRRSSRRGVGEHAILLQRRFVVLGKNVGKADGEQRYRQRWNDPAGLQTRK